MLAACTEGTSWQLSRDIWAALDLSEVTKSIQGFGTSLRIGSDQATLCHMQTGGPNTYKEYSLASSPFPSTFSGSSDECSTPINLSTVFLHVQSKSHLDWGYFQTLSVTCIVAAPQLCSLSLLPAPPKAWIRTAGLSWHGRAGPLAWTQCRGPAQPTISN